MIVPYQGFVGGTYQGRSRRIGSEVCRNWIPEPAPPNALTKNPLVFTPTPGTKTWCVAGNGPIREMFQQDGRAWVVSGSEQYEVTASASATLIGAVASSSLPAQMDINGSAGHQLMTVSGGMGYIFDLNSGAFVQITDPDFPANAQGCVYLDSFFMTSGFGTRSFSYSASFDGLLWSATDVAEKELTTDNIRAIVETHEELWLIGRKNIEPWAATGDGSNPFAPIDGVKIEHGIGPTGSLVKAYNTIAFIQSDTDGDRIAVLADGYDLKPFTTPAIAEQWASYQQIDDAVAWTYQLYNHTFYVVSFPSAKATWAFDFTTSMWHEWTYLNPATGGNEAHLGRSHMYAFGKHLIGSRVDGTIYEMDGPFLYDADSKPILRERIGPHIFKQQGAITVNTVSLDVDAGIADATGPGSDPQVGMMYSIDGGETYSEELLAGTGKTGKYLTKCDWDRLGQGPDWVFRFATTAPVRQAWTGCSIDAEGDDL